MSPALALPSEVNPGPDVDIPSFRSVLAQDGKILLSPFDAVCHSTQEYGRFLVVVNNQRQVENHDLTSFLHNI